MGEGIEIAAPIGGDVAVVGLEHQKGSATVAFTGELFGTTVALRTMIDEGGAAHEYLSIYGYLERVGNGVTVGAKLETGNVIGAASDSGQGGVGHIYFEVRRLQEGAPAGALDAKKLGDSAVSAPCDVRNVLPLRH